MPCWPGLLLEVTHDKRLVPSYGIFSFRLSVLVPSRPVPYHPGLFAEPSSACVLVPPFGIFSSKLLTFRKIRKLFPLTVLQIKDLPRWWTRWTNGLYRGPTQEKNYLLLAGIEPVSPSCESDVLPLDHGLPLLIVHKFSKCKFGK